MAQMKTSEEWSKTFEVKKLFNKFKLVILDPDGWDRANWDYSWYKELISLREFYKRLEFSTCRWNIGFWDVINNG